MSRTTAQARAAKRRGYRLGKRAEKQAETRRRIVEAAVELHGTLGPARTTISEIAERAGVQRHTFYAHFPDDRSLFLACSGLAMERDELRVVYQPIVEVADELAHGAEALVRWAHPELGLIGPEHFIAMAEDTRLVVPLGAWVLREAVTEVASWTAQPGDAERA